jgi:hypothetical protein
MLFGTSLPTGPYVLIPPSEPCVRLSAREGNRGIDCVRPGGWSEVPPGPGPYWAKCSTTEPSPIWAGVAGRLATGLARTPDTRQVDAKMLQFSQAVSQMAVRSENYPAAAPGFKVSAEETWPLSPTSRSASRRSLSTAAAASAWRWAWSWPRSGSPTRGLRRSAPDQSEHQPETARRRRLHHFPPSDLAEPQHWSVRIVGPYGGVTC